MLIESCSVQISLLLLPVSSAQSKTHVYTNDGISVRRMGSWKKTKVARESSDLHVLVSTVLNLIILQNLILDFVLDLAPKLPFQN